MATYPGVPQPTFSPVDNVGEENSFRSTMITLHTHMGTHVDSPAHLLKEGVTIDKVDLSQLCGKALVLEVTSEDHLSEVAFQKYHKQYDLTNKVILLKTGEGKYLKQGIFREEFLTPSKGAVELMVSLDIKAIGLDTLSVDSYTSGVVDNHPILFKAGIPVVEGLFLDEVSEGEYFCCILPLKLGSLDGSPARAVLIEDFS